MSHLIKEYIKQIQSKFDTGGATEHTYRITLETLLLGLSSQITVTNEHERIVGVGMPDFTIKSKQDNTIPLGRIEAKDLHISLDEKKNEDQLKRYKDAFDNFIYTNYLTFIFYRNGKKIEIVQLGQRTTNGIERKTDNLFDNNIIKLENLLREFLSFQGITITSPEKLAKAMAQKAQLIKFAIASIFEQEDSSNLELQYQAFKSLLVHDLTKSQFADMYAQTVAYGLFSARLYDPTLNTFSREEAEKLIPKSTPFIRWLFKQMSSEDEFDERIAYIIDDLVNIFLHCNVAEILKNYGKKTKMEDPIIHFYETFLGEYDSSMRKKRGVYYTPEPVVKFIVKGVDYLLKTEFGLTEGLADTSKVEKEFRITTKDHRGNESTKKAKKSVHRVQILDPATGTGTFLNEVVHYIYENYFQGQQGLWSSYVSKDLLPRIWGFEILMASYTMAHLKLGLTLTDTGRKDNERVNIYLTNSLEEPHDNLGTLFSQALAKESEEASMVKREQPIMVVIGNPPYSGISSNNGEWISKLIEDYKWVNGVHFGERKHWLGDDYVKFIRYAEHFIEKNGEGIIAFINNHGFLDNPTFRGMRWHLLQTFDSIYVLDLHGNSKKRETTPDGGKDENVFDIQAGVSIQFFVKTGKKKVGSLAKVYHSNLRGVRDIKYDILNNYNFTDINYQKLSPQAPYYFFVENNYTKLNKYESYYKISKLFISQSTGTQTGNDKVFIGNSMQELQSKISNEFGVITNQNNILKIDYRPFDKKFMYFIESHNKTQKGIKIPKSYRSRFGVMKNYQNNNHGFIVGRQGQVVGDMEWNLIFLSQGISDLNVFYRGGGVNMPLYLYHDEGTQRKPNLDQTLIESIIEKLGASRSIDGQGDKKTTIGPEDIFDYIYAVLHSPTYRETYKEFLKTDFPRVPFTDKLTTFWQLVVLGNQLRTLHLMEGIERKELNTTYPIEGDNTITKMSKDSFINGKVYINDAQYFEGVSEIARNFRIGGYQPAQKRLKDRQGETLSYEDIIHYQKIVYILSKTNEIMQQNDEVNFISN